MIKSFIKTAYPGICYQIFVSIGKFIIVCFCLEIYRIVSQKQLRDPSEEEATIRPNNVETINVKPTVNSESVRKQCCNS